MYHSAATAASSACTAPLSSFDERRRDAARRVAARCFVPGAREALRVELWRASPTTPGAHAARKKQRRRALFERGPREGPRVRSRYRGLPSAMRSSTDPRTTGPAGLAAPAHHARARRSHSSASAPAPRAREAIAAARQPALCSASWASFVTDRARASTLRPNAASARSSSP